MELKNEEMGGDSYATPSWLMDLFEGWFDPCPLNKNPEIDGLSIEWGGENLCQSSLFKTSSLGKKSNRRNEQREVNSNASKGRYFYRILPIMPTTRRSNILWKKNKIQWKNPLFCFNVSNI